MMRIQQASRSSLRDFKVIGRLGSGSFGTVFKVSLCEKVVAGACHVGTHGCHTLPCKACVAACASPSLDGLLCA